jgi:hypothetical protein
MILGTGSPLAQARASRTDFVCAVFAVLVSCGAMDRPLSDVSAVGSPACCLVCAVLRSSALLFCVCCAALRCAVLCSAVCSRCYALFCRVSCTVGMCCGQRFAWAAVVPGVVLPFHLVRWCLRSFVAVCALWACAAGCALLGLLLGCPFTLCAGVCALLSRFVLCGHVLRAALCLGRCWAAFHLVRWCLRSFVAVCALRACAAGSALLGLLLGCPFTLCAGVCALLSRFVHCGHVLRAALCLGRCWAAFHLVRWCLEWYAVLCWFLRCCALFRVTA